jgi:hypothetical protein
MPQRKEGQKEEENNLQNIPNVLKFLAYNIPYRMSDPPADSPVSGSSFRPSLLSDDLHRIDQSDCPI